MCCFEAVAAGERVLHSRIIWTTPLTSLSLSLSTSSTWCPASPCPRTCRRRRPQTYLRRPPRPRRPSRPWPPCPRCPQCWAEPTCPAWAPCAVATRTNTPCRFRQVGPTTQHTSAHINTYACTLRRCSPLCSKSNCGTSFHVCVVKVYTRTSLLTWL